jgi:molybdopterin molybdotransferase
VAPREFFTVRRVSEALAEFRPARRTAVESIPIARAHGRVLAREVRAGEPLPGFARSAVDGYAVRAADTFGASDGLPSYLDLDGSVLMGRLATSRLTPGRAISVPTGGALPEGADAVVMLEHAAIAMESTIEVVRPVAPGEGVVAADEDLRPGDVIASPGRHLRPAHLALLAAAGIVEVDVHARPRVAILSTGDEIVPPATRPDPGQVRDATATGLAALVQAAGGAPESRGIVRDEASALERALREAREGSDVVVVSAGSSVGARDVTAAAVAALGPPGIWCHGLALRPGKPTLLAECDGVPVIGLPGNPMSALVVFRLIGMPVLWRTGGLELPPSDPTERAVLAADLPSQAGRLDVVQIRLRDGRAEPLHGRSALLSPLVRADGYLLVPEAANGLYAGTEVDVVRYG